ncbi:MAG: YARHG domain-containing protein, partial [Lachnoanaerobaculum sp.]|nr:YARHG domain-containing protein [Lachnoanaerobaculum sp.]
SAGNNELHIEVPFIYHVIISDTLPKEDYGEIVFTKYDDGKWRISKISHWYNDIVFYGLGKRMYLLDNYCKTKSDYEQFVERFGFSSSGDRIPMDILQISHNEILPNSDKLKFGEFINGEFPELFTKLTAYLAMEEIYARHGKPYEKVTFEYEYFNKATAWYKENSDFSENMLNDIEIYNISKLSDYIDGL